MSCHHWTSERTSRAGPGPGRVAGFPEEAWAAPPATPSWSNHCQRPYWDQWLPTFLKLQFINSQGHSCDWKNAPEYFCHASPVSITWPDACSLTQMHRRGWSQEPGPSPGGNLTQSFPMNNLREGDPKGPQTSLLKTQDGRHIHQGLCVIMSKLRAQGKCSNAWYIMQNTEHLGPTQDIQGF